jgi:hypothetical protein
MKNRSLKDNLILLIGSSIAAERKILAKEIIDDSFPICELLDILYLHHPVSTRFSWLLTDLCEMDKNLSPEILKFSFEHRKKVKAKHFDRVIAKQAFICGMNIPENIEVAVLDWLIGKFSDKNSQVTTRYYAKKALLNLNSKYPELRNELFFLET